MLICNLVYILQSGQYDMSRFLSYAYTHLRWWHLQERQHIDWTLKARMVWATAWALIAAAIAASYIFLGQPGLLVVFVFIPGLPLVIGAALLLIRPIDWLAKLYFIHKAKKAFAKHGCIVIGITGSYGKTSTKDILFTILSARFRVLKTPENINTDLGIAQFVLKHPKQLQQADIFIVEMGAYQIGDIRRICDIVQPDYAILTGINASHLQRFGSIANTIRAKFELPVAAKNLTILNVDDPLVRQNHTRFSIKKTVEISKTMAQQVHPVMRFGGISFEYQRKVFRTKLLAEHNVVLILMSAAVADALGMEMEEIIQAVKKIDYTPHRLQPIHNPQTDVWVIDDSYNGNIDGIKSGIAVLKQATGRKIVLTPGLVELGEKEKEIHVEIGRLYAHNQIDLVLLIKNRVTDYIIEGMKKNRYLKYRIYPSTQAAHADLGNILKRGDTILFQNDWPDVYF